MAEGSVWSRKRKSLERGDIKVAGAPKKIFQSPLIITAPSGKTATKTRSRLPLFDGNSSLDEDQIKQQFVTRISEAEALLKQKRGTSQESILSSLCKAGLTTPRKCNPGTTVPNPFSFMTPARRRESISGRRDSVAGGRESVIGRAESVCGRRSSVSGKWENLSAITPCKQPRPRISMSARKGKWRASMQLRMLESQELQASRLAQVKWEVSMEKQERAYAVMLSEILKQPMDPNLKVMEVKHAMETLERSSGHGAGMRSLSFDSSRGHLRNSGRKLSDDDNFPLLNGHQNRKIISKAQSSGLRTSKEMKENTGNDVHAPEESLNQLCNVLELKRRLIPYLEESKCDRIITTMTQIAKHIDDGRLRMKPNCIVLSDVALRTKALCVLFSYNPGWLRLGLAIVLGPIAFSDKNASMLSFPELDGENQPRSTFLEVLVEEHFFGDSPLARQFAMNRSIDGLYRDGYKEALGKLIMKRIFLLVLVLDKIKSETSLDPLHGIDGLDGGSPLLFLPKAGVKSSRQALEDFLSHVMQGEGDLIVHMGKLGYHVSHIQAPLSEYNFEVRNVVEDLQDGIRLCRLAQLMSHDLSILGKIKFPCQAPKKKIYNCELALQSLAQSGVLLQDESGASIAAEHIASGQRQKTVALIWNLILHLQVPRLVRHPKLFRELERIGLVANPDANGHAVLDMLLSWVQAICANVEGVTVQNFNSSFADGQVLCHLISNFLPQCLPRHAIKVPQPSAFNAPEEESNQNVSWELHNSMNINDICKDRAAVVYNFQMVKNAAKLLGIAPEVLLLCDMVDEDPWTSERNIIIFIAHLCPALLNAVPQSFPASSCVIPFSSLEESNLSLENCSKLFGVEPGTPCSTRQDWTFENAATCIQAWFKGRSQHLKFQSKKKKVVMLQRVVRAWLMRGRILKSIGRSEEDDDCVIIEGDENEVLSHEDLSNHVLTLQLQRQGSRTIQRFWREYLIRRQERRASAAVVIQSSWRGYLVRNLRSQMYMSARTIQKHFRRYFQRVQIQRRNAAALVIQKFARGCFQKAAYRSVLTGVKRLQALFRGALVRVQVRSYSINVTKIQAVWRGCCSRRLVNRWRAAASVIQLHYRGYKQRSHYKMVKIRIAQIQASFRGALIRRRLRLIRQAAVHIQFGWRTYKMRRILREKHAATIIIQSRYRCFHQRKCYQLQHSRFILLQSTVRGYLARKKFRGMREAIVKLQSRLRGYLARKTMEAQKIAAIYIQRRFRSYLRRCAIHQEDIQRAAITIQSFYRSHVQRNLYHKDRLAIVRIQSAWRGFVQRKAFETMASDPDSKQATIIAPFIVKSPWRRPLPRNTFEIQAPQHFAELRWGGSASMQQQTSSSSCNFHQSEAAQILTLWAKSRIIRCRFLALRRAAVTIQRLFRGRKSRQGFQRIVRSICCIQAHWRGHKWRSGQSRMKQHMQELRIRMQSTAATVENSQRLGNRLTEALAQLLSQKSVTRILSTFATIDMATEHSKECCDRLAEGGAVSKLLMLIQTLNRSPPHEQVLKHALSILANLARFPNLAFSIAGEAESINIIVEKLLIFRVKEEVFSKAMKILLHVCRTPGCVDIIQQDAVVLRRLHNVSALLERRVEVEKRNLEKLPPHTAPAVRNVADRKMRETILQTQSIMSIMPGLTAHQLIHAAPTFRKDTEYGSRLPPAISVKGRKGKSSTTSVIKEPKDVTIGTAASATLLSKISPNCKSGSICPQRSVDGGSMHDTVSDPLSGERKCGRAVEAAVCRPNSASRRTGERACSATSSSIQTKSVCASSETRTSQYGLPRVPLQDRSNNATEVVRK